MVLGSFQCRGLRGGEEGGPTALAYILVGLAAGVG